MSGLSLYQDEHAACGVGLIVNIPNPQNENIAQHQLVHDALTILENYEYRSGVHPATDECDGAGIRFFGLPTSFFNRLLINGNFELTEGTSSFCLKDSEYAIGNFFSPMIIPKSVLLKRP
ncbi:MAG: hypothetical protein EBQ95_07035 [Gammaproteobacteria bacterium]|nr:hypothetical protein [Gammaproteobacteria bacterium]